MLKNIRDVIINIIQLPFIGMFYLGIKFAMFIGILKLKIGNISLNKNLAK